MLKVKLMVDVRLLAPQLKTKHEFKRKDEFKLKHWNNNDFYHKHLNNRSAL